MLVYLHEPATDLLRGTYYDSQGIQSTFNLGQDGKYYQQWSKEALEVDQIRSLLGIKRILCKFRIKTVIKEDRDGDVQRLRPI